ncbi:uncharacterized protein LOC104584112 [Brachypodium distachyon]|uniref:uncharacterized protein LOC104584112 n=1 Tax=Brachypodium distachyon TaxID=15368 RepID=UPI00052FDB8A|nr:uncharacterized protein LOC104584112 [Brachypodium distachyon]|eukprot:XP_010236553.1 uncharacterized protein LOC104584112 [Brachypodium distachyon]
MSSQDPSSGGGSQRTTRSGKLLAPQAPPVAESGSSGPALPPPGPHRQGRGPASSMPPPPPAAAAAPSPTTVAAAPTADPASTTAPAAAPTSDEAAAAIATVEEPQARVEEMHEQPPVVEVEVQEEAGAFSLGSEIAMSDSFEHGEKGAEEQLFLQGAANEEKAQGATSQATASTTQSKSKRGTNKVPSESWVVTKLNKESYPEEPVEAAEKFANTGNAIVLGDARIYQTWSDVPEAVKQDCYEAAWKRFVSANDEIRQTMKTCDTVSDTMIAYRDMYNTLEGNFDGCELAHVSRASNEEADHLVNLGSTRAAVPPGDFLEIIHQRSIKEKSVTISVKKSPNSDPTADSAVSPENPANEQAAAGAAEVLAIEPTWMKPLLTYMLRQELPEDTTEARRVMRRSKAFTVINGVASGVPPLRDAWVASLGSRKDLATGGIAQAARQATSLAGLAGFWE